MNHHSIRQKEYFTPYNCVEPGLDENCSQSAHRSSFEISKLPFFVGAGGFEPPASWSRKKQLPLNPAKIGHYFQILVHQVHRVTQFHYSLVTVPIAQHPCSYGWQGIPTRRRQRRELHFARGAICGPVSARCTPIVSHQEAIRMIHAGVLARIEYEERQLLLIPPRLIMRTTKKAYHCPFDILLHEPYI